MSFCPNKFLKGTQKFDQVVALHQWIFQGGGDICNVSRQGGFHSFGSFVFMFYVQLTVVQMKTNSI